MRSPFPGMNPYLEQKSLWRGFHDVNAISDTLAPQVDPYFFVEIEEYLFIHEPSAAERIRAGNSDVSLTRSRQIAEESRVGADREWANSILKSAGINIS